MSSELSGYDKNYFPYHLNAFHNQRPFQLPNVYLISVSSYLKDHADQTSLIMNTEKKRYKNTTLETSRKKIMQRQAKTAPQN